MKQIFDILFVTTMPSFYKVRLFNEIAKERKIFVVYTGSHEGIRSADFSSVQAEYDSLTLSNSFFVALFQILRLLVGNSYDRAIVSGWDNIISYVVVLLHRKTRNGCIIESSILESKTKGLKALCKRFLLSRILTVYASGKSQRLLAETLGFTGDIIEFGGCGLLYYQPQPAFVPRKVVRNFLFVGRIAKVKNLQLLISVFNKMPQLELTIIGEGPLRDSLELMANHNIHFLGAVDNKDLSCFYQKADVFVLPSESEPWGLVVEEALNNGTPVIVSSAVGCSDSIVTPYSTGIVFESGSFEALMSAIVRICCIEYYNIIRENVSRMNFEKRSKNQVQSFL